MFRSGEVAQKSHFGRLRLQSHFFNHYSRFMTTGENETNIDVNAGSFILLDSSRFETTDLFKARITALALPIERLILRLAFHHL